MKPKYGPPDDNGTPERLPLAADDVDAARAPLARRLQQRKRNRIDHRNDQHAHLVRAVGEFVHLLERAEEVRLLDHQRRNVLAAVALEARRWSVAASVVIAQKLE